MKSNLSWLARLKYLLLRKIAKPLILLWAGSCRVVLEGREHFESLRQAKEPIIILFWHCHIFYYIYHFRRSDARPLISLSSDGELMAQVAEEMGMKPVRGSSSRGGFPAFLSMVRCLRAENAPVLITADGPRGPAREIKDGTVQLAARTGAAIIPVSWYSTRVKVLTKSWDRFLLPLPFGRIHLHYGHPLHIPAADLPDGTSEWQKRLAVELNTLEEAAIARCR